MSDKKVIKAVYAFLKTDEKGKYALVAASAKKEVMLELDVGVSVRMPRADLPGTGKIAVGTKVYFDAEGKATELVAVPEPVSGAKTSSVGAGSMKVAQQAF
jgi:hypothetical protein